MSTDPVVTEARIEYAQGILDLRFLNGSARATLTMSNGKTQTFDWFHDEISYTVADFLGKTMEEIRLMHIERDTDYLRS